MNKKTNRWALKNARTGAVVKSKTFSARADARVAKRISKYPVVIFDIVNNVVVR